MKYPQAPRAALGLTLTLMALLAPHSTWAAPMDQVQAAAPTVTSAQTEATVQTTPAREILAWHRVGSPLQAWGQDAA